MTDELKGYLEQTKKNREQLKMLAKKFLDMPEEISDANKSAFPALSPKRFKLYQEELNEELKSMLKPLSKVPKFRSVSYKKRRISAIYLTEKLEKACFFPPLKRIKDNLISYQILKNGHNNASIDNSPSALSTFSNKIVKISNHSVNQSLFTPILKVKYSII